MPLEPDEIKHDWHVYSTRSVDPNKLYHAAVNFTGYCNTCSWAAYGPKVDVQNAAITHHLRDPKTKEKQ
jgi:hypothetical protein